MDYLKKFVISFGVFVVVDLAWLGVVAKSFYSNQLGPLMRDEIIWPVATLFYILFVIGLLYFAIEPGLKAKSSRLAVKNGALYGFFTYMTYELTNYSVISNWPAGLVLVDIMWGVVLATVVSLFAYLILDKQN